MSDKPKMIEITDSWTLRCLEASQGELDCPKLIDGKHVDAAEFKAWRSAQSQSEGGK
jgi:hypothetical protein